MAIDALGISAMDISDEDLAAKLVRMPSRGTPNAPKPSRAFDATLREALRSAPAPRSEAGELKDRALRDDRRLKDACVEMESIFVGKMLKEMRKTVEKTGWINGGHAEEIFEDMLYDEYALSLSKNSRLGLADQLYKQLKTKI